MALFSGFTRVSLLSRRSNIFLPCFSGITSSTRHNIGNIYRNDRLYHSFQRKELMESFILRKKDKRDAKNSKQEEEESVNTYFVFISRFNLNRMQQNLISLV